MAKKNKFKRNKSDIPSNIFDDGGIITDMYTLNISGPKLSQSGLPSSYLTGMKYGNMGNTSNIGSNLMSGLGNTALGMGAGIVGNLGGNLIAGGKSSGIGNTVGSLGNTIGSAAMAVNPLVGGVILGGTSLLGGAFNAAFGSKLNKERIALAENEINAAKSFNADASDFDALSLLIASQPVIAGFSQSDIGSDGLFSNKAKNKYRDLLAQKLFAEAWQRNSILNNATNLQLNLLDNLLLNYAAYGGLLDINNSYSDGGPLSSLVKDINERSNADFVQRLLDPNRDYILDWESDNIATHKLGWATDDKGAIVFPNIQRIDGKLYDFTDPKNKRGKWDALDSAIQRGDTLRMSPSQAKEFTENYKKYYPKGATFRANGGTLSTHGLDLSNGVIKVNAGGLHSTNPYEGVQMGIDNLGVPNLVEEGEVIFNDYVFSNRIRVPDAVRNKYKLRGAKNMTFADAAKKAAKESEERPNDPISLRGLEDIMNKLANEQEVMRKLRNMNNKNKFKGGGKKNTISLDAWNLLSNVPSSINIYDTTNLAPENKIPSLHFYNLTRQNLSNLNKLNNEIESIDDTLNRDNLLRYAPAFGSALGVGYGLLSKPNYSRADALALFAQNAGKITPISYDPLGNYLTYRPTDLSYQANRMAALAGATRRNIMNTSGGNRANAIGSLLAADYNSQIALADAIRQGEDTNWNRLIQTETFNRGTNLYNSEAALKAAVANQEARMKASQLGLSGYTTAMKMKDDIDALRNASISANFTNLFDSLGDIGREEVIKGMVKNNPALLYDYFGRYKGNVGAKGGKINRKKRGGFTY